MIVLKRGNILDAAESIVHQVNCQNVMGSGVANAIYTKWPIVKREYHAYCDGINPFDLLGAVQAVEIEGGRYVFNVFGQLNYGRSKVRYTDYPAVEQALMNIKRRYDVPLAFPFGFGCGLANGDWKTIEGIICDIFDDREVGIYRL